LVVGSKSITEIVDIVPSLQKHRKCCCWDPWIRRLY